MPTTRHNPYPRRAEAGDEGLNILHPSNTDADSDYPDEKTTSGRHSWLVRLGVAVSVTVVGVVMGAAAYGLIAGTKPAQQIPADVSQPQPVTAQASEAGAPTDPQTVARQGAAILFDWDTTADTTNAITQQMAGLGDPSGNETAGLVDDVRAYLPDAQAWGQLQKYGTKQ